MPQLAGECIEYLFATNCAVVLVWRNPKVPYSLICINNSSQEARFQNTAFRMSQSITRTPAFNINRTMDNVHFANLSEYLDFDAHDL